MCWYAGGLGPEADKDRRREKRGFCDEEPGMARNSKNKVLDAKILERGLQWPRTVLINIGIADRPPRLRRSASAVPQKFQETSQHGKHGERVRWLVLLANHRILSAGPGVVFCSATRVRTGPAFVDGPGCL